MGGGGGRGWFEIGRPQMGLDHERTEQRQGCRVSQGIRWQRGELPFIQSFHGLQRAGRCTGVGGGGLGRAIKQRAKVRQEKGELAGESDRNENKEVGMRAGK